MFATLKDRTIKILGHEYQLSMTNKSLIERNTIACICPNTLTIEISTLCPKSRQEEGLLHEIIEALNCHLELKLEHEKITSLSEGLYQVFKDNFIINTQRPIQPEHSKSILSRSMTDS